MEENKLLELLKEVMAIGFVAGQGYERNKDDPESKGDIEARIKELLDNSINDIVKRLEGK